MRRRDVDNPGHAWLESATMFESKSAIERNRGDRESSPFSQPLAREILTRDLAFAALPLVVSVGDAVVVVVVAVVVAVEMVAAMMMIPSSR